MFILENSKSSIFLIIGSIIFAGQFFFVSPSTSDSGQKLSKSKPNIILIIADDLGFNDVSFRGSLQIPTPNLDALAFSGIILNNYYVSPICTPSRSSLFSGIYPIHSGLQNNVIYGTTPYGLPLDIKIMPEYLKEFGYCNHLVGKWHLGHFSRNYTPTFRGFDTHYGSWTGHKDYYDNMAQESNPEAWGYDMRRGLEVTYENLGQYSTDLYTDESIKIIERHRTESNSSSPLFLVISHVAVHSANPYNYLQAPGETIKKFSNIKDPDRRKFAAMVSEMDKSVGKVVQSLAKQKMLQNSIIIFTTDNGGPAAGFNANAASNWPLRGVKNTLWEGGVRGAAFLWSPLIKNPSRISSQLFHVSDWLPTLIKAIGFDPSQVISDKIDGIDLWEALNQDYHQITKFPKNCSLAEAELESDSDSDPAEELESESNNKPRNQIKIRKSVLHNIDDIYGNQALRWGDWKIMQGTTYNGTWDGWYGPSGREKEIFFEPAEESVIEIDSLYQKIFNSLSGKSLQFTGLTQLIPEKEVYRELFKSAQINCTKSQTTKCNLISGEFCLFNIAKDPCEYNNRALDEPQILSHLKDLLEEQRKTAVPPLNKKKDPRAQPKFWYVDLITFTDHSIKKTRNKKFFLNL